jgi:hypothetical protein
MRSALPSLASSKSALSQTQRAASHADDGVWITGTASQGRGSSLNYDSDPSETDTRLEGYSTTSRQTSSTWANAQAIEQTHGRGRGASVANSGFAKQGAVKKTATERAKARFDRETQRNDNRVDEAGMSDDDDDRSDGSGEWIP